MECACCGRATCDWNFEISFSVSGRESPHFEYFLQNSYPQVSKERPCSLHSPSCMCNKIVLPLNGDVIPSHHSQVNSGQAIIL